MQFCVVRRPKLCQFGPTSSSELLLPLCSGTIKPFFDLSFSVRITQCYITQSLVSSFVTSGTPHTSDLVGVPQEQKTPKNLKRKWCKLRNKAENENVVV